MNNNRGYLVFCLIIVFSLVIGINVMAQTKEVKQPKNILSKSVNPWTDSQLITTEKLNSILLDKKSEKPVVLMVGFDFLYDQGHIPGSIFSGTASEKKGLEELKNTAKNYKKNQSIVIYCGCCPMNHCPNVRPAFETLKKLGYKNVKVLDIQKDFESNWKNEGYRVSTK